MTIEPFDDLEDFFEREEQAKKEAEARVREWQRRVKPGDYFYRYVPFGDSVLTIYGEILEGDEPYVGDMANYRFCRAYSVACPEGELGDVHISVIGGLMSREDFELARSRGWR